MPDFCAFLQEPQLQGRTTASLHPQLATVIVSLPDRYANAMQTSLRSDRKQEKRNERGKARFDSTPFPHPSRPFIISSQP